MKKIFALVAISILAALTAKCAPATDAQAQSAEQPAQLAQIQASATPSLQPSATQQTGTPTPDYIALAAMQRATLDVQLAEARNTYQVAELQADQGQTQAARQATAARDAQSASDEATARVLGTEAESAKATRTQAAIIAADTAAVDNATQAAAATATVQAPITRRLEVQADWEPIWQLTWILAVIFLVMLLSYGFIMTINAKWENLRIERKNLLAEYSATPAPSQGIAERPTQAPAQYGPFVGGLDLKMFLEFMTFDELKLIARGVELEQKNFNHDTWTPSKNGTSEGKFATLEYIMEKYKCGTWKGPGHNQGLELNEAGHKVLRDVIKLTSPTPPPPDQEAPEEPEYTPIKSIDTNISGIE